MKKHNPNSLVKLAVILTLPVTQTELEILAQEAQQQDLFAEKTPPLEVETMEVGSNFTLPEDQVRGLAEVSGLRNSINWKGKEEARFREILSRKGCWQQLQCP